VPNGGYCPIVYTGSDPVEDGLVTSLGRPEDNVTGIALSINPQTVMAITVAAPPYSHIATRDPTGRRSHPSLRIIASISSDHSSKAANGGPNSSIL
jgi:hypothetical protein